jgi:hypothetical protein
VAKKPADPDKTRIPPFETHDLRTMLKEFLDKPWPEGSNSERIGDYRWGVYAFFDYDGEPIYVGQTNEQVRTRIRRHLTNQRTDAVAMSVLDPFEVHTIRVYPLPEFEGITKGGARKAEFKDAKLHLNALEREVHDAAIAQSKFGAILNEKDPAKRGSSVPTVPPVCEGCIVSPKVFEIRSHLDYRISRRALIISRLAQVIAEREVKVGLRRVLFVQARRLESLAVRRFEALGGQKAVAVKAADEEETDGDDSDIAHGEADTES